MQNLGHTRSAHRADHFLLTPDTFVRAPLPGMVDATAIVHVSPAAGAKFTQYTAEFEAGGSLGPTEAQRFVYVIEGHLAAGGHIGPSEFVYVPAGMPLPVRAEPRARAAVIEKPLQPLAGFAAPELFRGSEDATAANPFAGDAGVQVRLL